MELTVFVALPDAGTLVFKLVVVGGPLFIKDSKLENPLSLGGLGLVVVGSVVAVVVGFDVEISPV